jgi:hypothetical protein
MLAETPERPQSFAGAAAAAAGHRTLRAGRDLGQDGVAVGTRCGCERRSEAEVRERAAMGVGRGGEDDRLRLAEVFLWSRDGVVWTRDHWGAVLSFAGAALAVILGLVLSTFPALGPVWLESRFPDATGSATLLAVIPLSLLGAFFLDRLEARIALQCPPPADATEEAAPTGPSVWLGVFLPRFAPAKEPRLAKADSTPVRHPPAGAGSPGMLKPLSRRQT